MSEMKNIRILSQANFSNISSTEKNTLYFAETTPITDFIIDGNNSAKIYNNGWMEYEGTTIIPSGGSQTITFNPAFNNANYHRFAFGASISSATNNSITISGSSGTFVSWGAKGPKA